MLSLESQPEVYLCLCWFALLASFQRQQLLHPAQTMLFSDNDSGILTCSSQLPLPQKAASACAKRSEGERRKMACMRGDGAHAFEHVLTVQEVNLAGISTSNSRQGSRASNGHPAKWQRQEPDTAEVSFIQLADRPLLIKWA